MASNDAPTFNTGAITQRAWFIFTIGARQMLASHSASFLAPIKEIFKKLSAVHVQMTFRNYMRVISRQGLRSLPPEAWNPRLYLCNQ